LQEDDEYFALVQKELHVANSVVHVSFVVAGRGSKGQLRLYE
jgi:hypothetical protein